MDKQPIDTGDAPITGNFEISLQAPDGAALRITGYVYAGEDTASLNGRIDICREALLRQRRKLEVPAIEKTMEAMEAQLGHVQRAYADLLEKKAGRDKMSSSDATAMTNYPQQIKHLTAEIEKGHATIAKAQSKD